MRMRHPGPAACAMRNNPAPTTTGPTARTTRSPAGARRSTVMAVPRQASPIVTAALAAKSGAETPNGPCWEVRSEACPS